MAAIRPRRSEAASAGRSRSPAWRLVESAAGAGVVAFLGLQTAREDDGRRRSGAPDVGGTGRAARAYEMNSNPVRNMDLLDRISTRQARIGVIGLGYVGLPLAVEFARAGFQVVGFDVDAHKVGELNAGRSHIPDVP